MINLVLNGLAAVGLVYTLTHNSGLCLNRPTRLLMSISAASLILSSIELVPQGIGPALMCATILAQDTNIIKYLGLLFKKPLGSRNYE